MKTKNLYMVFDVESIGLHGEGFSVGYVVIEDGEEIDSGYFWTSPDNATGTHESHRWVGEHLKPAMSTSVRATFMNLVPFASTKQVREAFWTKWTYWKGRGAVLAADCPWPVEAHFLNRCVQDDSARREWEGPYPMIGIESVRLAAGLDPLGTNERSADELPVHHPTADARQSARLLLEALAVITAA